MTPRRRTTGRIPLSDGGFALVETLIALVLLMLVGVSAVGYQTSLLAEQVRRGKREVELLNAERVLAATTLLTRVELEQRIGNRPVGEFTVRVTRPEPDLFRIAVISGSGSAPERLVTVVYRKRPAS